MNKALKITLIALGSLLAVVILATIIAAPVATAYVNKNGRQLVGRDIHIDKLRLNVYTGHVAIHNFTLFEDDGTTPFVAFDTLDVQARLLKLLSSKVYLKHITLAGLDVNVLQDGDHFNFTSLLDHFASDEPEEPEQDTTPSNWKLYFYNINLSHGRIHYADLQRNADWNIKDLNIKIPGFCIGGQEATDAGLTIELADGGTLTTDAHYDVNTNDFAATLDLDNFAISNIRAYLTDFLKIGTLQGALNAHVAANGNLSQIMQMDINGHLGLDRIDIRSDHNEPVLALSRLAVDINHINLDQNLFDIQSVNIDGLRSRFDLYADGSNFSRLMIPQPATTVDTTQNATADTAAQSAPMKLHVAQFRLTDGALTYADHTLPDPFEFPVTQISLTADNLSLSGENAARINALLPHGGSAYINWRGTLDDIKQSQSLKLDIKNLQLADLSPYTVAYLGQPFTDGTFSFLSLNTIRHSQLDGQNHLDIYKATVGKKRKDVDAEINIPLKAALYVLKDKDDKIQIDLPISGDLDNPEFKYMKVVWKTLGNLLVKVATEPFRAVGNALGISKDDEMFIAVDPQQQDLTSEQYYQLDRYASAMNQVSGLIITMEHQVDAAADSTALTLAAQQDKQVENHLIHEMNVPAKQLVITTRQVESLKKSGYFITGKLEEAEE